MSNWTTGELRVLRDAHATRRPGMVELALLLPRHTQEAVRIRSEILGLRTKQRNLLHWLRIAHRHFSQRYTRSKNNLGGIVSVPTPREHWIWTS